MTTSALQIKVTEEHKNKYFQEQTTKQRPPAGGLH